MRFLRPPSARDSRIATYGNPKGKYQPDTWLEYLAYLWQLVGYKEFTAAMFIMSMISNILVLVALLK